MLRILNNSNMYQSRTLRPEYNGLDYACELHPAWDRSKADILPGTVMARVEGEYVAPLGIAFGEGDQAVDPAGQEPFGLSLLFVAPKLGIDETTATSKFAVAVGQAEAVYRVHAPAFDTSATWKTAKDGSRTPLYANDKGLLTPVKGSGPSELPVATLIEVSPNGDFIRISLNTQGKNF